MINDVFVVLKVVQWFVVICSVFLYELNDLALGAFTSKVLHGVKFPLRSYVRIQAISFIRNKHPLNYNVFNESWPQKICFFFFFFINIFSLEDTVLRTQPLCTQ